LRSHCDDSSALGLIVSRDRGDAQRRILIMSAARAAHEFCRCAVSGAIIGGAAVQLWALPWLQSWGTTGGIGAAAIIGAPVVVGPDIKRKIASGIEPILPLIDIGSGIFTMKVRRPRQGQCLNLARNGRQPDSGVSAVEGRAEVAIASPDCRA
jgi:hypothetical protein